MTFSTRPVRKTALTLTSIVAALTLSACATVVRTTLPANKCFTEMVEATGVDKPTPHAALPDDTAGGWVDYGNRESGQLDIANEDKRAIVGIGQTCERWQAEAVRNTERKAWWDIL